jgi:hypothetical protein
MFAWALAPDAPGVAAAMRRAFERHSLASDAWVVELSAAGARVLP